MIDSNDVAQAKSTPITTDSCIIPTERHDVFKAVRRKIEQKYGIRLRKISNRQLKDLGNYSVSVVGSPDSARAARDELLRFIYPSHEHQYSYSLQLKSLINSPGYLDKLEADFDCSILNDPDLCVLKLFGNEEALLTAISALDSVTQTDDHADTVRRRRVGSTSSTDYNTPVVEELYGIGQRVQTPEADDSVQSAVSGNISVTELNEELRRLCAIHDEQYDDYIDLSIFMKQEMLKWLSGLPVPQGNVREQAEANAFSVSSDEPVAGQSSLAKSTDVSEKSQAADADASGDASTVECDRNDLSAATDGQDNFDEIFDTVTRGLDEEAANPSLSNDQLLQRNLQRGRLLDEVLAVPKADTASASLSSEQRKAKQHKKGSQHVQESGVRNTPASVVAAPLKLVSEPSRDELRAVIIDGNNVAREHGRMAKVYSSRGIRLAVEYFQKRGHRDIVVYVPQWRPFGNRAVPPTVDGHLLVELHDEGLLEYTPSRKNPVTGRIEASYDDWYIVNAAYLKDGVMVSNDQFRDVIRDHPEFLSTVAERTLPFNFLGDNFIVPPDPRGRSAPSLDQLLRKSAPSRRDPTVVPSNSNSQQFDFYRSNAATTSSNTANRTMNFPPTSAVNGQNMFNLPSYAKVATTNDPHWPPISNQPSFNSHSQSAYSNPMSNPEWFTAVGYYPQQKIDGYSVAGPNPTVKIAPRSPQKGSKKSKENLKNNPSSSGSKTPQQLSKHNGHQSKYDVSRDDIATNSDEERSLLAKVLQISQNDV